MNPILALHRAAAASPEPTVRRLQRVVAGCSAITAICIFVLVGLAIAGRVHPIAWALIAWGVALVVIAHNLLHQAVTERGKR